jgi:hypothetical protein
VRVEGVVLAAAAAAAAATPAPGAPAPGTPAPAPAPAPAREELLAEVSLLRAAVATAVAEAEDFGGARIVGVLDVDVETVIVPAVAGPEPHVVETGGEGDEALRSVLGAGGLLAACTLVCVVCAAAR